MSRPEERGTPLEPAIHKLLIDHWIPEIREKLDRRQKSRALITWTLYGTLFVLLAWTVDSYVVNQHTLAPAPATATLV